MGEKQDKANTGTPKTAAYVAVQDMTWCGKEYKTGDKVPVSGRNEIRRLKAQGVIEEKE